MSMEKTLKHVKHIKETLQAIKENNILKDQMPSRVVGFEIPVGLLVRWRVVMLHDNRVIEDNWNPL